MSERYPDPFQEDPQLYKDLLTLPEDKVLDLAWVKVHVWEEAETMEVPREGVIRGMQANMFKLVLNSRQGKSKTVMVKRVVPRELPSKPSPAVWQAFIVSVRTEIQFYRHLQEPEQQPIRQLFPQVHHSCGTPEHLDSRPMDTAFNIVMQDLSVDYFQKPMMSETEARHVLDSLASLHCHYWGSMAGQPRGSFWPLDLRRGSGEVEEAGETWIGFLDRFPALLELHPQVRQIGNILKEKAEDLNRFVEEGAVTRIHGDAKGWNFFFGKTSAPRPFLFIDMQWTGRGHPLQDVAYALTTSLSEEALPKMEVLVDHYVTSLTEKLKEKGVSLDSVLLRGQYDKVWLDYARVIVSALWKRLNPDSIVANKEKVGPSMINRSWPHVEFITRRLCQLLLDTEI